MQIPPNSAIYPTRFVTDQMGQQVRIPLNPQRIISLVPSQTELLFDLGLGDKVVGITKFCIHPKEQVKSKNIIGGTKNFNLPAIHQLQPDLIIGNKEENYQEGILELQKYYPVWMSDIYDLDDAYTMITAIGEITNSSDQANLIVQNIQNSFEELEQFPSIPTAYFIWREPYMSIGKNTFIHAMMNKAGFQNIFSDAERYPAISAEALRSANPKLILLPSEPYPFKEKHIQEFLKICPEAAIKLVDGEMFCWYGSRLKYAASYFRQLREELKISN